MLFLVELNIKETKKVGDILLKAIDCVKTLAININK